MSDTTDIQAQVKSLGTEILNDAMASLGSTIALDPEQQAILARATMTIAESTILGGVDPTQADHLAWRRDAAYATLGNLRMANAIVVQQQVTASEKKVISRLITIGLAAIAGATGTGAISGAITGAVGAAMGDTSGT